MRLRFPRVCGWGNGEEEEGIDCLVSGAINEQGGERNELLACWSVGARHGSRNRQGGSLRGKGVST